MSLLIDENPILRRVNRSLADVVVARGQPNSDNLPYGTLKQGTNIWICLPLVIGPGANAQSRGLDELLTAAPSLRPQLESATWVGRRRWDLNFQTGETVALPEGQAEAKAALAKFARLDKSAGLLGRGIVRVDLRIPGKMVVRLPNAPAASPQESNEG